MKKIYHKVIADICVFTSDVIVMSGPAIKDDFTDTEERLYFGYNSF